MEITTPERKFYWKNAEDARKFVEWAGGTETGYYVTQVSEFCWTEVGCTSNYCSKGQPGGDTLRFITENWLECWGLTEVPAKS